MRNPILCLLAFVLTLFPARSFAQIGITGTLLGADGNAMVMAHIVVMNGPTDTTVYAPADASGHFALELNEPGGYGMYATGVHHETLTMPLILTENENLELHIRLGVREFDWDSDKVYAVATSSDEGEGVEMQRRPNGTYAARLEVTTDTVAYRIRHGKKMSEFSSDWLVAGTNYDRLLFDESGPFWDIETDYYSVIDVSENSMVDIIFNPSILPRPATEPKVSSNPSIVAEVANIYLDVEESERRFHQVDNVFRALWVAKQERAPIKRRLRKERDPLLQNWLILRYFDGLPPLVGGRRLAQEALESIPPDSPLWSYEAWSTTGASNLMYMIDRKAKDDELVDAYVRRVIDEHPDPGVQVQFLYFGVNRAHRQDDEKTKWLYYSILQDEHADARQAEWARRDFDPDRQLQAGNPVPQFSFVSFDDSTVTITDHSLRGQTYLLDFWGTWCAPCIEEIPALERTYELFKDSGFEILSVAFLDDRVDIEQFRKERYPMPWLHTRVSREEDRSIRELFEITSFPRPILVSEDGVIIAIDNELRDGKVFDAISAVYDGNE